MNSKIKWGLFYGLFSLVFMIVVYGGSRAVTVISESTPIPRKHTIVLDAGHGGVDGGATSCTGKLESSYNLEITLRLNDLLTFLGYNTALIRNTDVSVYTKGDTIAQKKVSDLKERVRIVNNTNNAVLISIHQNHFSDNRYSGAQVFYPQTPGSEDFARQLQTSFIKNLNPGSKRAAKKSQGIYLMENVNCTAVLIECGFLSNTAEAHKLEEKAYQQKLCAVIATELAGRLSNT